MLKRLAIIAPVILTVCLAIGYPVCRGRLIARQLVEAVEQDNVSLVRTLLDKGASVHTKNRYGTPLLIISAAKGYLETTRLLLDMGATVNARNDVITKSVRHPLYNGPVKITFNGLTALQIAAVKGDKEMAELLLARGADADIGQNTATAAAAGFKNDKKPIEITMSRTPLYIAIQKKDRELIKVLLPKTTNVNYRDEFGCTPLCLAVMQGQTDLVRALLEKGADTTAEFEGDTLLHLAITSHFSEDTNPCADPTIAEMLILYGANVNAKNKSGFTPLFMACFHQCPELAKLLLDNGADINVRTKYGNTLLQIPAFLGYTGIVELLLDYGIDANVVNDRGETVLDTAINRGCVDIAEILKNRGAKTSAELNRAQ